MNKKYFQISAILALLSVAMFIFGLIYGFTYDLLNIVKPITVFQYSTFLAFAFSVAANKERLRKSHRKDFWLISGFFVAMASFYEILFNFFYWFSLYNFYGFGSDLDSVRNLIQPERASVFNITNLFNLTNSQLLLKTGLYPINLNFASKIVVLIFFCSLYWIYAVHSAKRDDK